MGFSFRKLFRIGRTNVSVSKSGVGVSTKIGGLRIGSTPKRKTRLTVRKGMFNWTKTVGGKKKK